MWTQPHGSPAAIMSPVGGCCWVSRKPRMTQKVVLCLWWVTAAGGGAQLGSDLPDPTP